MVFNVDAIEQTGSPSQTLGMLALISRVTLALSGATGTEELARHIARVLTSPLGFHFSRVFLLRYDDRRECFSADLALGIADGAQAQAMAARVAEEEAYLDRFAQSFDRLENPLLEMMGHLRGGALAPQSGGRAADETLAIDGWADFRAFPGLDEAGAFFTRLIGEPFAKCNEAESNGTGLPEPLRGVVQAPFVSCAILTGRGVRLAIVADRAHQADPSIGRNELMLLEWFRAQAGVAWASAEMYADLEQALDHLREVDLLKNSFLATISHELRTPLTAILGYLKLMLDSQIGPVAEQQRLLLDRVHRQAGHLLGLVNDLLELAEFQAGGLHRLPVEPVVVHHALRAAMGRVADGPRHEQAQIEIPARPDEPFILAGNGDALERIVYHLLDNAVKFSAPGDPVAVTVQAVGENCHISIADRGIGIDRAQMRKVFSHFYQVDARLSRAYPGMGIGLTLVKQLLEATGGHIVVESELGQGSVFTVVYPAWRERS